MSMGWSNGAGSPILKGVSMQSWLTLEACSLLCLLFVGLTRDAEPHEVKLDRAVRNDLPSAPRTA